MVATTFTYALYLFLCVSLFQSLVSLAVPLSSSHAPEKSGSDLKALNTPLFPNTRRNRGTPRSTELIIKTFFLIDNTTKENEAQERVRFQGILDGINSKLRKQGAFDGYHFQIEATEVAFQKDFYEKEDTTLVTQFESWKPDFPKRFPNRDVYAAMVLTKRSFFAVSQRARDETSEEEKKENLEQKEKNHLSYWQHFPTLYNESTPSKPFSAIIAPAPWINISPKDSDKWKEYEEEKANKLANADKSKPRYVFGTMGGHAMCIPSQGSGVISGYGDIKYLNVFEGIFVHEFFHGFGIAHDPLFVKECTGYIMNDGVDMNTPIGFSPCSKMAMDELGPTFPCIFNQYLKAHPEFSDNNQKEAPSDNTYTKAVNNYESLN